MLYARELLNQALTRAEQTLSTLPLPLSLGQSSSAGEGGREPSASGAISLEDRVRRFRQVGFFHEAQVFTGRPCPYLASWHDAGAERIAYQLARPAPAGNSWHPRQGQPAGGCVEGAGIARQHISFCGNVLY